MALIMKPWLIWIYLDNQLKSDPLWLMVIAPSSNAKMELLRGFMECNHTSFISSLTPSTLVSGLLPKSKQPDPSLLMQLDGKTLVIKDFTTILTMRYENQQEILSQLREIYDGQFTKVFGNGKKTSGAVTLA